MNATHLVSIGIIVENQLLASKIRLQLQHNDHYRIVFDYTSFTEYQLFQSPTKTYADVLLLELDIKENQNFEVVRHFADNFESAKIIVLSSYTDVKLVAQLLKNGVHAFRSTSIPLNNLDQVISDVLQYGAHISPDVANLIRKDLSKNSIDKIYSVLTKREIEIAKSIIGGKSYKELSEELFVSVYTVNHHLKNIYKKLEINSKSQLVALLNSRKGDTLLI